MNIVEAFDYTNSNRTKQNQFWGPTHSREYCSLRVKMRCLEKTLRMEHENRFRVKTFENFLKNFQTHASSMLSKTFQKFFKIFSFVLNNRFKVYVGCKKRHYTLNLLISTLRAAKRTNENFLKIFWKVFESMLEACISKTFQNISNVFEMFWNVLKCFWNVFEIVHVRTHNYI